MRVNIRGCAGADELDYFRIPKENIFKRIGGDFNGGNKNKNN